MSLSHNPNAFASKLRVLLVDDERDISIILSRGLEGQGFDVSFFNDPSVALEHFAPETSFCGTRHTYAKNDRI